MNHEDLMWEFQRGIIEVYKNHELTSLRGLEDDYMVNGRQIISWHSDVVRDARIIYRKQFDFIKNFDDMISCSDEIMYFTANLFFYRPYLNSPLKEGFHFGDRHVYPNNQNLAARRYAMFDSIVSEKLYNYWDRIGDMLAALFPELLKPHQVFFSRIIDVMPEKFYDSANYKWLKEFKENEFEKLNKIRKRRVHYHSSDTDFKYEHMKAVSDHEQVEKIEIEREAMADYYKEHITHTLNGFEKAVLLVEEIIAETITEEDVQRAYKEAKKEKEAKAAEDEIQ